MTSPIPTWTLARTERSPMLVELLRLVGWLFVVIIVVSLIALLLTQGKL